MNGEHHEGLSAKRIARILEIQRKAENDFLYWPCDCCQRETWQEHLIYWGGWVVCPLCCAAKVKQLKESP